MDYNKRSLAQHKKYQGKIEVRSLVSIKNKDDLSLAYTPGVAAVCLAIAKDKRIARTHTLKGRTVAVVSDGSAILGLGNLGALAALPVMEGKAALFKTFADVDAFPIVLDTQDTEEIIATVKAIAPTFGGINLEDIAAPRCFEIEERLKQALDIPVFHDDQHGTAIVVAAAFLNALRVVKKDIRRVRIVINGAGAAAVAVYRMLVRAGVMRGNIIMLDSKGILHADRGGIRGYKQAIAHETNREGRRGGLDVAIEGVDVFIGVSAPNVLTSAMVETMADVPVVFAMANPDPEIAFEVAQKTKIAVLGTGRSDHPNQINNVLIFPGIFRGALDVGAREITEDMKLAAALAIAKLVTKSELSATYIIPKPFDKRVVLAVANAVKKAWRDGGR
ncbi:MAG: malate dehydrogenase [Candidatus Lloydbacteria bacterium RIFCSPHIGHO2_01_FULL_49_22]|uniref:Malate dehydrogenase n=1 Tax=Candidatus Lloydbacteria bacterium RIFCSPHIGHO2_01_FULL_49_22 TaxID=1798658 RepID=A0A1G2CXX6_9BACT|nr:MAG: malate dehydrogenase [Candidatus Lloydbacteria bacterium RIFCSPHIGHO2_01_FULL_49_22]OGZ10018.1 MAG: malate dehydrogenase [Candidatus Lloydbacteria bacterium RIFCSPHIGHO2_02_FULL_50_18]